MSNIADTRTPPSSAWNDQVAELVAIAASQGLKTEMLWTCELE